MFLDFLHDENVRSTVQAMTMLGHCSLLGGMAFGEPLCNTSVILVVVCVLLLLRVIYHSGRIFFLIFPFLLVVCISDVLGHFVGAKAEFI
jgi:hypothetical protein